MAVLICSKVVACIGGVCFSAGVSVSLSSCIDIYVCVRSVSVRGGSAFSHTSHSSPHSVSLCLSVRLNG